MLLDKLKIGIDLVEINRFKQRPFLKNKLFYKKIFTPSEINYCLKFKDSYRHFAGKFAIKEATKKSISEPIDFKKIQTYHIKNRPMVKISNLTTYVFMTSLSHEKDVAIAVVISENIG